MVFALGCGQGEKGTQSKRQMVSQSETDTETQEIQKYREYYSLINPLTALGQKSFINLTHSPLKRMNYLTLNKSTGASKCRKTCGYFIRTSLVIREI